MFSFWNGVGDTKKLLLSCLFSFCHAVLFSPAIRLTTELDSEFFLSSYEIHPIDQISITSFISLPAYSSS